jgi:hypothetical protein
MDNLDIFTGIIVQFCDTETLSKLARTSENYYSIIRQNPIYRQFAQCWQKQHSFYDVCRRGYIHIAQWIYKCGIGHPRIDEGLYLACEGGHLEVAQWLYKIGAILIAYDEHALSGACVNGHLKVAQWLVTVKAEIHAQDDLAFRLACEGGHLEVAQWLQKLNANPHARNDDAFIQACRNGHLEVAKWLHSFGGINVNMDLEFPIVCGRGRLEIME